jgi:hypothetical protein
MLACWHAEQHNNLVHVWGHSRSCIYIDKDETALYVQISGHKIDVSQLTRASYGGQALLRAIKRDPATDEELKELGEVLQAPGAAEALVTMPPGMPYVSYSSCVLGYLVWLWTIV